MKNSMSTVVIGGSSSFFCDISVKSFLNQAIYKKPTKRLETANTSSKKLNHSLTGGLLLVGVLLVGVLLVLSSDHMMVDFELSLHVGITSHDTNTAKA